MNYRPEHCRLNPYHRYAEGAAFLGIPEIGAFSGSMILPDARRGLGLIPRDGTLTSIDPATGWVQSATLRRYGIQYDSSNADGVACGIPTISGSHTLCAWVRYTNLSDTQDGIIDCLNSGTFADGVAFGLCYPNSFRMGYYNTNTGWQSSTTALGSAGNDVLHHVAVAVDAGVGGTFYLNGVEDGTWADVTSGIVQPTEAWRIGYAYNATGSKIAKQIFDPLAFDRCLSSGEIKALADRSNVMLSGLLLSPQRRIFPVAVAAAPYWIWAKQHNSQIIGGGVA